MTRASGFDVGRAALHDSLVENLVAILERRGYEPQLLPVDGNRPDIQIKDHNGDIAYIDPKTRYPNQMNYSIKRGSLIEYVRLTHAGRSVYVVWLSERPPLVDDVFTLAARITGGPRRPTGKGSQTDWLLVRPGGTPFNDFFPGFQEAA